MKLYHTSNVIIEKPDIKTEKALSQIKWLNASKINIDADLQLQIKKEKEIYQIEFAKAMQKGL